jgi:hypothetical protein
MPLDITQLFVGQKVKLKPYEDCLGEGYYGIVTNMLPYTGNYVTIASTSIDNGRTSNFRIAEDDQRWCWDVAWIDETISDPNYKPPVLNDLF